MDDATKARLNLLWTELSRLVERADADDGSDDDDDDDDDDDVLEADRRLRASMPPRRASTSPRRLFSFARLRRLFVGADDNGIKRTISAPSGRNLVDF